MKIAEPSTFVGPMAVVLLTAAAWLASPVANADPPTGICNQLGSCSYVWCPGSRLPMPDVVWDMNVCHHYYGGTVWRPGTDGGIQVGAHIIEGDPSPANTCGGSPICLPGL